MRHRISNSIRTSVSSYLELETDHGICEVYFEGQLNWCPGSPGTVSCLSLAQSPDEYYGTDAEFEYVDIDDIQVTDEDGAEVELNSYEYEAARRFVTAHLEDSREAQDELLLQAAEEEEARWCNYDDDDRYEQLRRGSRY